MFAKDMKVLMASGSIKDISDIRVGDTITKKDNKAEEALKFGVDERSIQRDVDDIRAFLGARSIHEGTEHRSVLYNRVKKGFEMVGYESTMMSNSEKK